MATIAEVTASVSEAFGLPVSEIRGYSRERRYVEARHCAFVLARKETKLSLPQIGGYFSGRDHTTVMHGLRTWERKVRRNPDLEDNLRIAENNLYARSYAVFSRGSWLPVFKSVRGKK